MDRIQVENTVKQVLREKLLLTAEAEAIGPETGLVDDLGMNSISFIEIVLALEEAFGISIEEDDLDIEHFALFSSLMSLLTGKYRVAE